MSMRHWWLAALFAAALPGCQTTSSLGTTVQPGYQPALDTDEAGLWHIMNQAEQDLKTSGSLINDAHANQYLREIVCKLANDVCADVRVYLVKTPYFNASMAPNGVMQVWSGLLLRVENEAQLAYILGHELAHYRYQHSLQMFRQAKNTANILAPFQVVTIAGGVGFIGTLAQLGAAGGLMKFSRDHEREADDGGFGMTVAAGYDPREAARVWENLQQEKDALKEDTPSLFLATHPSSSERVETLKQRAQTVAAPAGGWRTEDDRLARVVDPLWPSLMRDELRLRQYPATQILLDRVVSQGRRHTSEVLYFQAELYSARAGSEDTAKAEAAYKECVTHSDAPPEAYRELGMIYMKSGRNGEAVPLFQTYLDKKPQAFDRNMITAYIQRIESRGN